jgi:benzoyl-CoA reductase subunit C
MWKLLYPEVYVRYIDVPQVPDPASALEFWEGELRRLLHDLGEVSGRVPSDQDLRVSIALYNEMRKVIRDLYRVRRERPWDLPTEELYLLLRAGEVTPPEEFVLQARRYLGAVEADPRRRRDNSRVIVVGAFCEQPPLGLIKSIERSGCYIVDDDFVLGNRFLVRDVPAEGDPVRALARAFVENDLRTAVRYEGNPDGKKRLMGEQVAAAGADGIIFATPSFCDPALLDQPMMVSRLEALKIPYITLKYAENSAQMQPIREQAGTFADSIKLWGAS